MGAYEQRNGHGPKAPGDWVWTNARKRAARGAWQDRATFRKSCGSLPVRERNSMVRAGIVRVLCAALANA